MRKVKIIYVLLLISALTGCSTVRTTGRVVGTVGKVGWKTAKVTGKVVKTTGKVAYKTGKGGSKVVRTAVYMARGKQVIPLEREGNSLYAVVKLNREVSARLLVDTGASSTLISPELARQLKIDLRKGEPITATLANGRSVRGVKVIMKEIQLRAVRVKHVEVIVLDRNNDRHDGLLGMSFLNHFVFQIDADRPELILQQKAK